MYSISNIAKVAVQSELLNSKGIEQEKSNIQNLTKTQLKNQNSSKQSYILDIGNSKNIQFKTYNSNGNF